MKIDEIKAIVGLMAEHGLTEFKIEAEDMHLCIRRGGTPIPAPHLSHSPGIQTQQAVQDEAPKTKTEETPVQKKEEERPVAKNTIDAPIIGTFYRASAPDADAFVKIGSKVNPDTVVCIIEAMKVMNEIKAEKAGVVKEILVENGNPVEFGQPLIVLE